MVAIDLIQKAIITALKANSALITALGSSSQIKEMQYQGTEFSYPAVRVSILPQTPIGNGTDHTKLSNVTWTIRIYSEQKSSQEVSNIQGLVLDALFDTQISGTNAGGVPSFRMIKLDVIRTGQATRLTENLWTSELYFESQVSASAQP